VFGRDVEFVPVNGVGGSVRVIFSEESEKIVGGYTELRPELHVLKSAIPHLRINDAFYINGYSWVVDRTPESRDSRWVVSLRKSGKL
jgi:hypothetical protein